MRRAATLPGVWLLWVALGLSIPTALGLEAGLAQEAAGADAGVLPSPVVPPAAAERRRRSGSGRQPT